MNNKTKPNLTNQLYKKANLTELTHQDESLVGNIFKGTLSLELVFLYMKDITFLNAMHKVKDSILTPFTFKLAD